MNKPEIHWQVLSKTQKKLLPGLKFLKDQEFYLAGGTALALQIGHRTSLDFDFYKEKKFDIDEITNWAQENLSGLKITTKQEHTLLGELGDSGLSVFYYPYQLIRALVEVDCFNLLSLEDLAAMKLIALGDRGKRRDFVDLYFLIKQFGLSRLFEFVKEKYPEYDIYHAFLGLTYFEDAEKRELGRYQMLKQAPEWEDLKRFFILKASQFKKDYL